MPSIVLRLIVDGNLNVTNWYLLLKKWINNGLPALRCPYEPLALDERDPFMKETNELGENLIIELMSNVSEYGDIESALFLPADNVVVDADVGARKWCLISESLEDV